tara:strand:+ start:17507 stop:17887 length:381 start_codon:yes stop_codon:yes gene_type:complete
MEIYHLKLILNNIPVMYDYYSAIIVSATSEEEARNLANKELYRGMERVIDLERVEAHYISFGDMKEKFAKYGQVLSSQLYQELMASRYGYVENNEIWKNPKYTEIVEIGSSHSTEPEVHTSTFHAG